MSSVDVITAFTSASSLGYVPALRSQMSDVHRYIDAAGTEVRASTNACAVWKVGLRGKRFAFRQVFADWSRAYRRSEVAQPA